MTEDELYELRRPDRVLTQQDIFNAIWQRYVVEQALRGFDPGTGKCVYRDEDTDRRCVVGFLLNAGEIEEFPGNHLVGRLADMNALPTRLMPHVVFLSQLQLIHDSEWGSMPLDLSRRDQPLRRLAAAWGLQVPA